MLKRYAFGPMQKMIDERRDRIRESIEEADRAREEARNLLEEHRKLIGQAKGEAEEILAEARKIADAQRERMREEIEDDRQRRLEETTRQIEEETQQALGEIRAEVASLTLIAAEKVTRKSLDRRRPAAPDRRGARPSSTSRSWRRAAHSRRAPHLRARAVRGRAGAGPARAVREELADFAAALDEVPELDALLDEPGDRLAREGRRARARARRAPTSSSATSCGCSSRRAAPRELREIAREFEALVAAQEGVLDVELTTAYELSDEESAASSARSSRPPAARCRRRAASTPT